MAQRTAIKAYKEKQKEIARLIKSIQSKLRKDAEEPINWASVGSLGYVEEVLDELDIFLSE